MKAGCDSMCYRGLRKGVILAVVTLILGGTAFAEPSSGKIKFRLLSDSNTGGGVGVHSSVPGFRESFIGSFDTSLTDPIENYRIKRVVNQVNVGVHRTDEDPDPARDAAHGVLSYQLRRYTDSLLRESELREAYRGFTSFVKRIERSMKVTVEDRGAGYSVSRKPKGKRIVDFGMELSTDNLIEPVMRFGNTARFRYDVRNQTPMVEMGMDF